MKMIILCVFFISSVYSKEITLNLQQAIDLALQNNGLNKISRFNLEIAKAQYNQALSTNYPTIDTILYANRDDRDTVFEQRGVFTLSSETTKMFALANTLSIPAGATRDAKQAAISSQPASAFPAGTLNADIDTVAKGRDTVRGQVEFNYPVYTGGKISSIIEQARLNKYVKKEAIVRDENNIVFDVKQYFYGYIITDELYKLFNSIYKNMKLSEDLTKEFLEKGTDLKIKRTDYLNIRLLNSLLKSSLIKLELNKKMLESAIGSLVGLEYDDKIKIIYDKSKILEQKNNIQKLIEQASTLNPDINSINLALKIKDEKIKEVKSENYPIVNLFANVSHTYNSYKYGYLSQDDKNRWSLGVVVKIPLFNGFKTKNKILESKIDKKVINEQKYLIENMIAVQLKNEFLKSSYGYKEIMNLKESSEIADESSKMNFDAYKFEMVQASDLVQSQLMEVFVKTQYLKSVHNYLISLATIDKLVGKEISNKL
ncbi:Outer membrane protein [Arcobacter nitrofigilis DSM 7299]|uniref:Outer membrane protein n=1 Tax=Arcobacter nitrofigilis (strain ATCC 33309 / DSM 7299 / CCUG 15893 / LMG 7604 / NCTC 12251 / CI) TaxID=572480 RepID=D5V778_ARCNC|nr:TolC family protein [Arcobacter nitrofigilis]ADG94498.1 Outer membrane protein [Arcobacter nitrofigilis DSM 7299]